MRGQSVGLLTPARLVLEGADTDLKSRVSWAGGGRAAEGAAGPQGKPEEKRSPLGGTESVWWLITPGVWSLRRRLVTDRTKLQKALLAKLQMLFSTLKVLGTIDALILPH